MVALADGDADPEPDESIVTAVCTRCCLVSLFSTLDHLLLHFIYTSLWLTQLRPCKWISTSTVSGNFCVEGCHRVVAEPKFNAAKSTLPNASSLRIVPTTMKLQTVSIRVPQTRKAVSVPINPLRKCTQCEQHILVEEKVLAWEAMEFCNEDCLSKFAFFVCEMKVFWKRSFGDSLPRLRFEFCVVRITNNLSVSLWYNNSEVYRNRGAIILM